MGESQETLQNPRLPRWCHIFSELHGGEATSSDLTVKNVPVEYIRGSKVSKRGFICLWHIMYQPDMVVAILLMVPVCASGV